MKVRDVMQRHVATVGEDETLSLAHQLMRWTEIRHLPVVRREDGRVIGILSERDLLRAAIEARTTPLFMRRPVRELMSSPAEHIHPNAELADAAADMAAKQLGCLPVIETGELVGIVTRADVLSVLAQYPVDYRAEKAPPSPPPVAAIMYPEPIAVRGTELLLKGRALGHDVQSPRWFDRPRKTVAKSANRTHRLRALLIAHVAAHRDG